jgi:hypothetical protein
MSPNGTVASLSRENISSMMIYSSKIRSGITALFRIEDSTQSS